LPSAANAHGLVQAAILGILIAGGIAIYGLLLAHLGVANWADAIGAIKRTSPRGLRR
jgi:putative peptidoglycan lipid II flippase